MRNSRSIRRNRRAIRRLTRAVLTALPAAVLFGPNDAPGDDTHLFQPYVAPNVVFAIDTSYSMLTIVWHPEYRPDVVYDPTNCPYIADRTDPNYDPKCLKHPLCSIPNQDSALSVSSASWIDNGNWLSLPNSRSATKCNTRTLFVDDVADAKGDDTWWNIGYLEWYFSENVEEDLDGDGFTIEEEILMTSNGARSQCLQDAGKPATYSKYRRVRITAGKEVLREVICQTAASNDIRFGLAHFTKSFSDPVGGHLAVPVADWGTSHAAALEAEIESLRGETRTPLAETLYNVYRYFQSRTSTLTALGKNGTTRFPVYDLNTSGGTSGTIPPSPVTADCQQHFVILITDGAPTKDDFDSLDPSRFENELIGDYNLPGDENEHAVNADFAPELSAASCSGNASDPNSASCESTRYLDDVAKFMQNNDLQLDPAFPDVQVIDTYTVGFTTSPPANSLLQSTADAGNGKFFFSNSAEDLSTSLTRTINEILDKVQVFASATVPAARTTDEENFYSSYFRPSATSPFWDGHLKNFKFTQSGEILTADDKCAVGASATSPPCPSAGMLRVTANAVWDAAEEMPAPIDRNLFVGDGAVSFSASPTAWFTKGGGTLTHTMDRTDLGLPVPGSADENELTLSPFGLSVPYTTTDLDDLAPEIVSSLAGCESGTLLGVDCTERLNAQGGRSILGDIFHSNPLVIGSPNARINDSAYTQFASNLRDRKRVIYAGSNDGWLHGFQAGIWQTVDGGGNPLAPPRHDRGSGEELFAFMPSAIRKNSWRLPISQPASTIRSLVTVDATPVAGDVWMYRDVNSITNELTTALSPPVSTTKQEEQWRTVLVGGLRDGGQSYYALDVSDPDASIYPGYLWEFPCDDCGNAENPGSAGFEPWMGAGWSEPVITRVKVAVDGQAGSHDRWVAIFGGGYDACGDPNTGDYYLDAATEVCDATDPAKVNRSRAIMMVDITTGELLAVKHFSASDLNDGSGQIGYDELEYGFPSAPAVFDLDFNGYADVVFIGDLGGNVWKWVIRSVGDDPVNNTMANDSLGQPNWPFELFFEAEHSNGASAPVSGTHLQNFFFPPTATLRGRELVLAFGAGERVSPQSGSVDSPETPVDNNHFYVISDIDPYLVNVATTTLHESDLVDVAALESGGTGAVCSDFANARGFFLTARDTEKFLTNSVIFLGDGITGSFLPTPPSGDRCSSAGSAFLYRFDVSCGSGAHPSNPGDADDDRRVAVGDGMPTRPRVSVGNMNGGGGGGCESKVVLITSDGGISNDCPGDPPTSGIDVRSWRQN